jgi:hypothetical protein
MYTLLQISLTAAIFAITLTRAAPVFPVLIIALVPFRLLVMKRWWRRDVFQIVDKWACREGSPEDEDEKKVREARRVDSASPATLGPRPDGIFPTITTNYVPRPNNACRRGLRVASSNTNQMSDMMAGSSRPSIGLDAHIIRDEEAVIEQR